MSLLVDKGALAELCDRYGVAELAVFGSVASGTARPDSDIDVLYTLKEGVRLGWAINDFSDELENLLGRPVDLVGKKALHPRLRSRVLNQAQVIYAA
ncbi:MAG: nucleotidyltransferase [Actinobacteria bacterium]|nr:nucleotidyltransferase [Actinomycetota bacterium]MTB27686.1 nucleotidyltransferase [Actinomycetota bacterium]